MGMPVGVELQEAEVGTRVALFGGIELMEAEEEMEATWIFNYL